MAWTTPRTWVTGEVVSKANLDAQIRDNLNFLKTNIALETAIELTIASGAVTKSCSHHSIDTQSDDATDDLDTISGGAEGEVILIRPASGARTVVIKHNTGNIWSPTGNDLSLTDADSYVLLAYSGSKWGIIASGGQVQLTGTIEDNDIAVFTNDDTLEGLSYAEFCVVIRAAAMAEFVLDEDTMVSDSASKVPTQQSVKAYVDDYVASAIYDYCFVRIWIPTEYCLQWEDSTEEVAVRKNVLPDSNPAVTLFNGFNVISGDLYVWY